MGSCLSLLPTHLGPLSIDFHSCGVPCPHSHYSGCYFQGVNILNHCHSNLSFWSYSFDQIISYLAPVYTSMWWNPLKSQFVASLSDPLLWIALLIELQFLWNEELLFLILIPAKRFSNGTSRLLSLFEWSVSTSAERAQKPWLLFAWHNIDYKSMRRGFFFFCIICPQFFIFIIFSYMLIVTMVLP